MALLVPLGALSDRIGRKPLLKDSAIGYLVLSYPAIRLMQAGHLYSLVIGRRQELAGLLPDDRRRDRGRPDLDAAGDRRGADREDRRRG